MSSRGFSLKFPHMLMESKGTDQVKQVFGVLRTKNVLRLRIRKVRVLQLILGWYLEVIFQI